MPSFPPEEIFMGYKLLLADDSITIQKVVAIIFANEDYDLTVVDNGNVALDKAREILPDVILVDALMPGKSGYDVCREIRQDPVIKDIPLLLLVGAFEPFDEAKAAESGADDHISKPFESQSLIEKVKKLVELGKERAVVSAATDMDEDLSASSGSPDAEEGRFQEVMSASAQCRSLADDSISGGESPDVLSLESMEIVEVTPEDDLWGAFEVTEVAEGEDVRLGEVVEGDELQTEIIDTVEEIEPFVFTEDEPAPAAAENVISLGELPDPTEDDVVESEESFVFREDPESEEFGVFGSSVQSLDFAEPARQGVADEAGEEISGADEYLSADVRESGVPGTINLSKDQLAAILSNVSREIIEKIAWEVVPDLAESIIREEIRKIKEGC
jgi:CheY-like chemotaxis protein